MPEWDRAKMDNWTTKKALFGQNDYIGMCERNLLQINKGGWFDLSGQFVYFSQVMRFCSDFLFLICTVAPMFFFSIIGAILQDDDGGGK